MPQGARLFNANFRVTATKARRDQVGQDLGKLARSGVAPGFSPAIFRHWFATEVLLDVCLSSVAGLNCRVSRPCCTLARAGWRVNVFTLHKGGGWLVLRPALSGGVMVAQGPLEAFVMVRIHAGQPLTDSFRPSLGLALWTGTVHPQIRLIFKLPKAE
jgi:hypothetical protein